MDAAESHLVELCDRYQIAWTLFRPTLVYGCGLDRNVMFIARCVRRFGFFPVVGDARGLRQPVHAEDVAGAFVAVLDKVEAFGRAYNLSGGSTLSYRKMVEAVFNQMRKPVRILRIPLPVFRAAIAMAKLLSAFRGLSTEMARRMNTDMCFDHSEAAVTLDFLLDHLCSTNVLYRCAPSATRLSGEQGCSHIGAARPSIIQTLGRPRIQPPSGCGFCKTAKPPDSVQCLRTRLRAGG